MNYLSQETGTYGFNFVNRDNRSSIIRMSMIIMAVSLPDYLKAGFIQCVNDLLTS
jgi:hypothetical protein